MTKRDLAFILILGLVVVGCSRLPTAPRSVGTRSSAAPHFRWTDAGWMEDPAGPYLWNGTEMLLDDGAQ